MSSRNVKRSSYSHLGCLNCKKVRQKCDEKKPSCTLCLNTHHECIYQQRIVIWSPNPGTRSSAKHTNYKYVRSDPSNPVKSEDPPNEPSAFLMAADDHRESSSFAKNIPSIISLPADPAADPSTDLSEPPTDPTDYNKAFDFNNETNSWSQVQVTTPNSKSNASSLCSRSPAVTTSSIGTSSVGTSSGNLSPAHIIEAEINSPLSLSAFVVLPELTEYGTAEWTRIMRGYRPKSFHNEVDLQKFLEFVFLRAKCGYNYPLGLDDNNPLWASLMEYTPQFDYLRYVILAVASNFMEIGCKCSDWTPYSRRYMDDCVQSLIAHISSYKSNDEINALLATVMILYSDRSASTDDKWRLHLKGALELVLARMYGHNGATTTTTTTSDRMFSVLRTWFALVESYAWISSPNGGTISIDQADIILNDSPDIESIPGLVIDGFNTVRCYGHALVPYFAEVCKMIIEQKNSGHLSGPSTKRLHDMLSKLPDIYNTKFDFSPWVPDDQVREIMATSHRVHCLALQLYIHTRLLNEPINSQQVQAVVSKMKPLIENIPLVQTLGIVIHWPVFMAGLCSVNIETRSVVEEHLLAIVKIGMYVARNSLIRLHKYWELYDNGSANPFEGDMDSISF